jgi:hypothetical protein
VDPAGVEDSSRTFFNRLRYDGTQAINRGRRSNPVSGQESVTLVPLEMLVRLCQHIPPPGFHLTRLYGAYANRTWGARARRLQCDRDAKRGVEGDENPVARTPAPAYLTATPEVEESPVRLIMLVRPLLTRGLLVTLLFAHVSVARAHVGIEERLVRGPLSVR